MNISEIDNRFNNVRELIKKAKFEDALNKLEAFIEDIGDKELDKEILVLTARYNQEVKEDRLGIKNGNENQNNIIYSISQLLINVKEVATVQSDLLNSKLKKEGKKTSEKLIFNSKVENAIIGNGNTVNIKNVKKNNKRNYPEGSIGFENDKANYIGYLIERYHKFKEYEVRGKMNYAILPSQLKRKYKIGTTRTIYHISVDKFEELTYHIQSKIEQTKLGKIKGRGHKKYSTFDEYKSK